MAIEKYRVISVSATAGATGEGEWSTDKAYIIKTIMATERTAQNLRNVLLFLKIGDRIVFEDVVPVHQLGETLDKALALEKEVPEGTRIYLKITNKLTVDVTVDFTLALHT